VLIADDESAMRKLLRTVLGSSGLRTVEAVSGAEAQRLAAAYNPDLVLLDLGLPDGDGVEVTRSLREWMSAPIVVVSAREREQDKLAAFEAGANDYVTKPFGSGELIARVRVWLRKGAGVESGPHDAVVDVGDLRIDFVRRLVFVAGRELHLTPTEYRLFATLMRNRGRVMTHAQLLEAAWGPGHARQTQYLRVYMGHLRKKLEPDATYPRYLVTESGVGYRLKDDAEPTSGERR
jgi:two-component system KDP operon response regulator KdpE